MRRKDRHPKQDNWLIDTFDSGQAPTKRTLRQRAGATWQMFMIMLVLGLALAIFVYMVLNVSELGAGRI